MATEFDNMVTLPDNVDLSSYEVSYKNKKEGVIFEKCQNKKVVEQHFIKNGNLHEVIFDKDSKGDGHKIEHIVYYHENGNKKKEEFYFDGKLHYNWRDTSYERDEDVEFEDSEDERELNKKSNKDKPAVIYYNEDGTFLKSEDWLHGKRVPSLDIEYDRYDEEIKRTWHIDGVVHREDGPACEEYYYIDEDDEDDEGGYDGYGEYRGTTIKQEWKQNGKYYRVGAPAYKEYSMRGNLIKEVWYDTDGKVHRDNGPAVIYYLDAQIPWVLDEKSEYWVHGERQNNH